MYKLIFLIAAALICSSVSGLAQPQWQFQTTPSGNSLLISIKAVSRDVAWACARDDSVYKTTNGGQNWRRMSRATTTETLVCIEARDTTTAFVGGGGPDLRGGNAKIYRTTNGGQSWEAVYTATGSLSFWDGIHFFDAQNGIALSDPPTGTGAFLIVKTTDGGTTWTPIANPPTSRMNEYGNINCFYFHDNSNGWFGTAPATQGAVAGRVFRTTDGGNTWNGFESGNTADASDVRFISSMIGIRTSSLSPLLTRSTDGGQTWIPVGNLPVADIRSLMSATSVSTANGHQLWVDGRAGASLTPFILSSADGGVTWRQQSLATLASNSYVHHMSAVSFGASSDSVRAWALVSGPVGTIGQILTYLNRIGQITAVKEQASLPTSYSLSQNYPNPFNPTTNIGFRIADFGLVSLKVYDVMGREVATLINEKLRPGSYEAKFEAGKLTSGIYFYRLEAGDFVEIKKMILVR